MKMKFTDSDWNFLVSDEELWPCLVYEYARSATWIHKPLLSEIRFHRNLPAASKLSDGDMARFQKDPTVRIAHAAANLSATPPSISKLKREFSWMIKGGWKYCSSKHMYQEHISYFPKKRWGDLPLLIRKNMTALFYERDYVVDLEALDSDFGSGASKMSSLGLDLLPKIAEIEEAEKTEIKPSNHKTRRGGVRLPLQIKSEGIADITAFMLAQEKASRGHIAKALAVYGNKTTANQSVTTSIMTFDWERDDDELTRLFRESLPKMRPLPFKDLARSTRQDAQVEVVLKTRTGETSMHFITPRRALAALGILRLKQGRLWAAVQHVKNPSRPLRAAKGRGNKDGWREDTRRLREEYRLAESLLLQWFPRQVANIE